MLTPLVTALARFVAALGTAVLAFRDLIKKQNEYDASKKASEEQK